MIDTQDVKRACVRGALLGLVNAVGLGVGSQIFYSALEQLADRFGVAVYVRLDVTWSMAAVFGVFVGLLAAPLTLVETTLARRESARSAGVGTAAFLLLFMTALVGLAALQALYTGEVLQGRGTLRGTQVVQRELGGDDALGYAIACLAGCVPVAVTTLLRVRGERLRRQVGFSLLAAAAISMPLLAFVHDTPDNMVPVHALGLWIFGVAGVLGPLESLADRWARGRSVPPNEPTG